MSRAIRELAKILQKEHPMSDEDAYEEAERRINQVIQVLGMAEDESEAEETYDDQDIEYFNDLNDRDKWSQWKELKNVAWLCYQCHDEVGDGPTRCSPFPGMSRRCGNCHSELTRRTGGGQHDPFGWIAREKE